MRFYTAILFLILSQALFAQAETPECATEIDGILREMGADASDSTEVERLAVQALTIAEEYDDPAQYALIWDTRGKIEIAYNRYAAAVPYLEQAYNYYKEAGDKEGMAKETNNLGILKEYAGDFAGALENHKLALAIRREIRDSAGIASSLNNSGTVMGRMGRIEEAIGYFYQSMYIDSLIGSPNYVSDVANLAETYGRIGNFEKALKYGKIALQVGDSLSYLPSQIGSRLTLSALYENIKSLDRAEVYGRQMLELAQELGKPQQLASANSRLASVMAEAGNWEESKKFYHEALNYAFADDVGLLYYSLGSVFVEEGLADSAKYYFELGMTEGQELNDSLLITRNIYGLLWTAAVSGDLDGSRIQVKALSELNFPIDDEELKINVFRLKGEFYQQIGEYKLAAANLDSAYFLSYNSAEKIANGRNDLALFDFYQQENKLLEQRLALDRITAKSKRNQLLVLLLGTVLLGALTIMYLLYRKRKQSEEFRASLQEKNNELTDTNHLLALAREDIHHRVQNDFHAISSLFSFQAGQAESPSDSLLLERVVNRIVAMGRIHSLLYRRKDRTAINLNTYLEELVDTTIELREGAYEKGDVRISRELDADTGQILSFTESTQLGMIVNELITNSLKYGIRKDVVSTILIKTYTNQQGAAIVEVSDQGGGVAEKSLPKSQSGGFGLNMIKELAEQMNWRFTFERSAEGMNSQLVLDKKEGYER